MNMLKKNIDVNTISVMSGVTLRIEVAKKPTVIETPKDDKTNTKVDDKTDTKDDNKTDTKVDDKTNTNNNDNKESTKTDKE